MKKELIGDKRITDTYKQYHTPGRRTRIGTICAKHGYVYGQCGQCSGQSLQKAPNVHTKDHTVGWWDNIDTQPVYIESKDHLRHECDKRGLMPKAHSKRSSRGKGMEWR